MREVLQPDGIILGENCSPFDDILHLPDITGPGILHHCLNGPHFYTHYFFIQSCAGLLQKMLGKQWNGFDPATKRWRGDGKDIQTIIEIFANPSLLDSFFQIFVGCGNQTYINKNLKEEIKKGWFREDLY